MPYDDSDVKKMIKYQLERKVGFSKSKRISDEAKDLIHCILEAQVDRRYTVAQITQHPWMLQSAIVTQGAGNSERYSVLAGETGAGGGGGSGGATRVVTPAAAVGNDTTSQNNNSNVPEHVLSRLLTHLLTEQGHRSSFSEVAPTGRGRAGVGRLSRLAASYALETAVDQIRLHATASRVWRKRRARIQLAERRPWR